MNREREFMSMIKCRALIEIRSLESDTWQVIDEQTAGCEGTSSAYGRHLLTTYLSAYPSHLGRARVRVWELDGTESGIQSSSHEVALIDNPDPIPPEIAVVEASREEVLRRRRALEFSMQGLRTSMRAAREAGHRADRLAELALPALVRDCL